MIEVSTLTALLIAETLMMSLGILTWMAYRNSGRARADRAHANTLIEQVVRSEAARGEELAATLGDARALLEENTRQEVLERERALYRQTLQAFLSRNPEDLAGIDQHMRGISEPYCRLIRKLLELGPVDDGARERIAELEDELRRERAETHAVREQLRAALTALEEVSNEYTEMFGAHHSTAELRASLAKILAVFHRAAHSVSNGILHESRSTNPLREESP